MLTSPSWMSMIGQRMLYRTGHPSDMNRQTNKPCGLDRTPGPYRNNKRQIMTEYEKMYRNDGLYAYGADRPPVSDPAFRKKADSMTDELTERLMRSLGNDPFVTLDVLLISAAKVLHGKCIEDLYEDYAPGPCPRRIMQEHAHTPGRVLRPSGEPEARARADLRGPGGP